MNLSSELKFEKPTGDLPEFKCHFCNKDHSITGWQMAEIRPFVDESADVSIVICSDECKEKLLTWEHREEALSNMIMHIAFETGQILKDEYQEYFYGLTVARYNNNR